MNCQPSWHNQTVLVMGLGRFGGGAGAARFALGLGGRVVVTDLAKPAQLQSGLQQLAGLPIEYQLGGHRPDDFEKADIVIVNPAVDRANNPYLQIAREHGARITSEIRLFIERLPNPQRVIAVTGTAGKSTVTAMIGCGLEALGQRVFVGGNLGGSLLNELDTIGPNDWVVLELSSFMLEGLDQDQWSAHIAVVTNFTANHLDRHVTLAQYQHAKQTILRYQSSQDIAVLHNSLGHWPTLARKVVFKAGDFTSALSLPGKHNQLNAAAASKACHLAITELADASSPYSQTKIQQALAHFAGLPHRLQWVCTHEEVRYFNDSKSTTPASAMLGISSFGPGVVHVLLGGYDKQSNLSELARLAKRYCKAVYTLGQTGDQIAHLCKDVSGDAHVIACQCIDHALKETTSRLCRGDVVLLSPGCASWDQFENYEQRGQSFVGAILKHTGQGALPPH